jgi:hypothetical protein
MRTFITFALVSCLLTSCYMSHEQHEEVAPPVPVAPMCPPASDLEPAVSIEMAEVSDVTLEAGTLRGEALAFTVRQLSGDDVEIAEFPGTIRALDGASLTTPSGEPALTLRFRVNDRSTLFGPEESEGEVEDPFLLWKAWMLRANHEHDFELVIDVADDASGTFEVTMGDGCYFTPRMWFVPEESPTVEMPMDLIGNNHPVTFRVTVVPST